MTLVTGSCFCGNFPELQARFIREVSAQRKTDPLSPLWVIVSDPLVGLALKRQLASDGCNHANIRFETLGRIAALQAERLLVRRNLREANAIARDALLTQAIERCGVLSYFNQLSSRAGFRRAVLRTLDGLRSAGMTLEMMSHLRSKLTNPMLHTLQRKVSDLAAVWESFEQGMKEHRYIDHAGLLELAAEGVRGSKDTAPVILYGLSELSELEKRFVAALLAGHTATAYLPYRESRAQAWIKPLFETFLSWGFKPEFLPLLPGNSPVLWQLRNGLFEEITPIDSPTSDGESFQVVSAPTREREVEETVRNVLYSPLADNDPARRTAILLRQSETYTPLLRSGFARAGVTGYFHECHTLGETTGGRALLRLTALLDEKFRRANVMEFLLSSPVKWPAALEEPLSVLPAAEWNQFSLLAGIVSGKENWLQRLSRLQNRFVAEQQHHSDEEDEEQAFRAERIGSLEALIRFVQFLFVRVADVNRTATWQTRLSALWELYAQLIGDGEEAEALLEALKELEELDALSAPLTEKDFAEHVAAVLSQSARRTDHFQVNEPLVAPMSHLPGLLFDEVIIPGLVEKELPRPVSADPLLLDNERDDLQKFMDPRWDVTIPTHARKRERERFLFHAALCSARKRIVLSYPRLDETGSRERLPSTYLLNVVEAVTARRADFAALDAFVAAPAYGRRIPISRLRLCDTGRAATQFQFHEAALSRALAANSCVALRYLIADHPFFSRAMLSEEKRFREHHFTCFDGVVEDRALKAEFRRWLTAEWPALLPAHLEQYTHCPYSYFVSRVLNAHSVEEPPELQRISPYERAILMHGILDQFYRQESAAGRLPLDAESVPRLRSLAERYLAEYESTSGTGVYLLWQIDRDRMVKAITDFVAYDQNDGSDYVPRFFGSSFLVRLDGNVPLALGGKLDRIDVAADGSARAVTYRMGKLRDRAKAGALLGWRALHLPVYRLGAEAVSGTRVESATEYFISAGEIRNTEYRRSDWEKGEAEFLQTAGTIHTEISNGAFFPFPEKTKCSTCRSRTACGAGRMTAKWKQVSDETRAFRTLAEVR